MSSQEIASLVERIDDLTARVLELEARLTKAGRTLLFDEETKNKIADQEK